MPEDRVDFGDDVPETGSGTYGESRNPDLERALRRAMRVTQARSFASKEELEAAMMEHRNAPTPLSLDELDPPEKAQELVFRAWDADDDEDERALMEEALAIDPRNVDALASRAYEEAESHEELIGRLEHAVRAGEEALGEAFFAEHRGHFWRAVETRPYMHTRLLLARHLAANGSPEAALAHYLELLELAPDDPQGVRYFTVGLALGIDEIDTALAVLGRFTDDDSAYLHWARVLTAVIRVRLDEAAELLLRARMENPYAEERLLDPDARHEEPPMTCSPGSDEEARWIAAELGPSWDGHSFALTWLAAERERAVEGERNVALQRLVGRVREATPDWFPGLFNGADSLNDELAAEVTADAASPLPWLLAVVEDHELHTHELRELAYAPAVAAELVAHLGLSEAAERLCARLLELEREGEADTRTHQAVHDALLELGEPGVEAALALIEDPPEGPVGVDSDLYDVLARTEEPNDRIYRHLLGILERDASWGALLLGSYGDDRAVGPLRAALARAPVGLDHPTRAKWEVIELCDAIEQLGADLTEAEEAKQYEARRLSPARADQEDDDDADDDEDDDAFFHRNESPFLEKLPEPAETLVRPERPSRNDRCWCGSGKEYKRCHLRSDEQDAR